MFIGFLVFIELVGLKFYELNKPEKLNKLKKNQKIWGLSAKTFLARIFYVYCKTGSYTINMPEEKCWRSVG